MEGKGQKKEERTDKTKEGIKERKDVRKEETKTGRKGERKKDIT